MDNKLILMTDSYKMTHWKQYPEGTTTVYSYLESRGGKFPATVFFGLQYIIKKYLTTPITMDEVNEAKAFCDMHIATREAFNYRGWIQLFEKHRGYLPLEIKAVVEGAVVPTSNVLMTIENTDPEFFWLTNYIETLLMKVWAPITIATNSFFSKQLIIASMRRTVPEITNVDFKLHDFGYRGVSSEESAGILGAAHLVSFQGTDTLAAIRLVQEYYNWNHKESLPGYSVVASEHSTATPYGPSGERKYVMNMLEQYPDGIISMVADSYDVYGLAEMIGTDVEIKEKILSRDGVLVLRPDSGDPVEVVSKVLDILWKNFGGSFTSTHYKLLDKHIRIIQGDGIDYEMIGEILNVMANAKYAADNIVLGSGGGLLQKFDRDTQKFAIKCSYCIIHGAEVNVQKDPVTSSGKKSKRGRLKLHATGFNSYKTLSSADKSPEMFGSYADSLQTVFKNGKLLIEQSFDEIRERVSKY